MTAATKRKSKSVAQRVVDVDIEKLKLAPWNPKKRIKEIGGLASSMEQVGQLQPILVTAKLEVIDGHRRIAARKALGLTTIKCIRAIGNQAELFAHANSTNRSISGNSSLEIFLIEPGALTPQMRGRCEACVAVVGIATLKRMFKEGFSLATWNFARKIAEGADDERDETIRALVLWFMKYRGMAGEARRAIEQGMTHQMLIVAAQRGKVIKARFAVE